MDKNNNFDEHEEVKSLLDNESDLIVLNRQYKGIKEKYHKNMENEEYEKLLEEKELLDEILFEYVFNKHSLKNKDDMFVDMESICKNAKVYVNARYLHNNFLTNAIVAQIIQGHINQVKQEIKTMNGYFLVTLVLWGISLPLAFLFSELKGFLFLLFVFYCIFFIYEYRLKREINILNIIHNEIICNTYDKETIILRLKNLEKKGFYMNSLIYSLLKIR